MRPRTGLLMAIIALPIVALAFHFGPGQRLEQRERAGELLRLARDAVQREEWPTALERYREAEAALPVGDSTTRWTIRRLAADARFWGGDLPGAMADLEALLEDVLRGGSADVKQAREVRHDLASANYYAAWLMRLEGTPTEEWTLAADEARQHFRLLAETGVRQDVPEAEAHQKDLEAAVRLARMDLSELQAQPLPRKCGGCKNVGQRCRAQRLAKCKGKGKGKGKGEGTGKGDIRDDLRSTGATLNERPSGSGS